MKKLLLAAATVALASGTAHAAPSNTATATGSATATVVAPLTISHVGGAKLNFGTFTAGAGGTVVVTAAGAGSTTSDVVAVAGNANSADQFTVSGDGTRSFNVTASTGNTVTGPGAPMGFAVAVPSTPVALVAGAYTLNVGGTLTVGASQTAGAYNGTYTVTVTYQ